MVSSASVYIFQNILKELSLIATRSSGWLPTTGGIERACLDLWQNKDKATVGYLYIMMCGEKKCTCSICDVTACTPHILL